MHKGDGPAATTLLEGGREREGRPAGTRAMIDMLLLGREHGTERVRQALEAALEMGCANLGAIRYFLRVDHREQASAACPAAIGALSRYDRPQPSLRCIRTTSAQLAGDGGDPVSTVPMQEATILQYAKQLYLPTLGEQSVRLADEAVKKKQSHLSYLEALLEAEIEERNRKAVARRIKEARFPSVNSGRVRLPKCAAHLSSAAEEPERRRLSATSGCRAGR